MRAGGDNMTYQDPEADRIGLDIAIKALVAIRDGYLPGEGSLSKETMQAIAALNLDRIAELFGDDNG
jgi:hypothetical protein